MYITGTVLACNIAMAQNWLSSGPPGSPVIPFDAIVTGTGPGGTPLYTCRGGVAEGFSLQVGRFAPGTTGCEFGYGGADISVPEFEFLVTNWQSADLGVVPPNAVQTGWDTPPPGSTVQPPLYPCRGQLNDGGTVSLQVGKVRPGLGGCFVPYGGKEISIGSYEVLVALNPALPMASKNAINGNVPQDAIRAGTDADGSPLYLCSANFSGGTHPGKLHSGFGGCNISYAGKEIPVATYSVPVIDWLGASKFDFPAGIDAGNIPLHVCRAQLPGGITYPGKMQASWNACDYALGGAEEWGSLYEVLSH